MRSFASLDLSSRGLRAGSLLGLRACSLAVLVACAGACGGTVVDFTDPDAATAPSGEPGGDAGSTPPSSPADASAPVPADSSAPVDEDAGSAEDAGPAPEEDAGPGPAIDAGPADTGPADTGTPATIKCGSDACDPKTEECCATFSSQTCVAKGKCTGGAVLACTDPSTCAAGQVCCARFGGGSAGARCAASCDGGFALCATNADCKAPQTCQSAPGGYRFCRSPGGGGPGGFGG